MKKQATTEQEVKNLMQQQGIFITQAIDIQLPPYEPKPDFGTLYSSEGGGLALANHKELLSTPTRSRAEWLENLCLLLGKEYKFFFLQEIKKGDVIVIGSMSRVELGE
ncbi:MAG: hypothetical protein AAF847_00220 [Bacteroidota bacterium]